MFPIRVERDTKITNWAALIAGFSTTSTDTFGNNAQVRSDGLTYTDFALVKARAVTGIQAANQLISIGVHMTESNAGDEYTLYSYSAQAWCADAQLMPILFTAISPATISSAAGGNVSENYSEIGMATSVGGDFNVLDAEGVVAIPEYAAQDRRTVFAIGFVTGDTACTSLYAHARLSVRRLVKYRPGLIDTTKLG